MLEQLKGKITIEPHPARDVVHGIEIEMFPGEKQVMVAGSRVAYCGAQPNRPICFIAKYPQEFVDSVVEFVTAQLGPRSIVAAPPAVAPSPHPAAADTVAGDDERSTIVAASDAAGDTESPH